MSNNVRSISDRGGSSKAEGVCHTGDSMPPKYASGCHLLAVMEFK